MSEPRVDKFFDELSITGSRKRISEDLFLKLRDAVLNGNLPGGFVLPNENELCKKLDIGRSTLREAYASLESMNLITRTKSGTYINEETDTRNLMNFDRIAHYSNPANLLEYRTVLEVGIAEAAALRATPSDVKELSDIADELEAYEHNVEQLTLCDFRFHQMIAKITGNELLLIGLTSVRALFEKFAFEAFKNGVFSQSKSDHRKIVKAIGDGNASQAGVCMSNHLSHIKSILFSNSN